MLCDIFAYAGGGTILPTTTRAPAPRRGGRTTVRGAGRTSTPALTGDHILPGGDPSQATHFGSIVSGITLALVHLDSTVWLCSFAFRFWLIALPQARMHCCHSLCAHSPIVVSVDVLLVKYAQGLVS